MYAGINSFITKPAISIAQAVLLGWALLPGLRLLVSFLALFLDPLAGPAWEKIKAGLAEKHLREEEALLREKG